MSIDVTSPEVVLAGEDARSDGAGHSEDSGARDETLNETKPPASGEHGADEITGTARAGGPGSTENGETMQSPENDGSESTEKDGEGTEEGEEVTDTSESGAATPEILRPASVSEVVTETASENSETSSVPESEAPKKAKRLTLQERLALAAKKKNAQKEAKKQSAVEPQKPDVVVPEEKAEKSEKEVKEQTTDTDSRISELERELKELRQKLLDAEKKARTSKLDSKTEEFEKKLSEKEKVIHQLMEEGQELSKKELKSNEKIKTLIFSNNKLESSLQNYAEKNQETLLKLGEVEDYLQKHKFKSIEQFMNHVADLQRKTAELENNLKREQMDDWQNKFKEYEKIYTQEVDQRKTSEKKLSEALLQIDLVKNQHELQIQSKDDIIAGLNRDITNSRAENAQELSRLETKIELLRSENENFLKFSQKDAKVEDDTRSNDADYIKLSESHKNLQSQYLSSQENWKTIEINFLQKIELLSESVQNFQTAKLKNANEVKRLHKKLNAQDEEMANLTREHSKLLESLKETEFQLKMKTNELADMEEKLEEVTTIFNSDRANYDLKIEALNLEIKGLTSQIETLDGQIQLSNSRKFRDSGLFIDPKPPLRSYGSQVSYHGNVTPMLNGSGSIVGQPMWEENIFQRSRDNLVHERNNLVYERSNLFYNNLIYESRHESTSSLAEEIYPSESPDADSSGIPLSSGATKNIQIISKMSSTVRRLETEIMTLKEENEQLVIQKQAAQKDIIERNDLLQRISGLESQLTTVKDQMAEKEKNEETLLEVIGEKSEKVEELQADVVDLKDLLRLQVQQMIEMQGK